MWIVTTLLTEVSKIFKCQERRDEKQKDHRHLRHNKTTRPIAAMSDAYLYICPNIKYSTPTVSTFKHPLRFLLELNQIWKKMQYLDKPC